MGYGPGENPGKILACNMYLLSHVHLGPVLAPTMTNVCAMAARPRLNGLPASYTPPRDDYIIPSQQGTSVHWPCHSSLLRCD